MPRVEWKQGCKSCEATGLFVGRGERHGAGVVCHVCKGTGYQDKVFEYQEFTGRHTHPDVTRVFQVNPGLVGIDPTVSGGVPPEEFAADIESPKQRGAEMREYTCPAWWYQAANYDLKPDWDECNSIPSCLFRDCRHFPSKARCWERFDREQEAKGH